jgi:hypothetical protein
MNTKPTQEEVGKMCVEYIEKHGYDKFSKEFSPNVYRKSRSLIVYCVGLGEISSPYNETIAQHQERSDEEKALKNFNEAVAKLQSA